MVLLEGGEVQVGQCIAAGDQERLSRDPVLSMFHRARGTQRLLLDPIADLEPVSTSAADLAGDIVSPVVQRDQYLGHAVAAEPGEDVGQDRPVDHRHHGLGSGQSQGPQPRALSSRHHDRLSHLCLLRSCRSTTDCSLPTE